MISFRHIFLHPFLQNLFIFFLISPLFFVGKPDNIFQIYLLTKKWFCWNRKGKKIVCPSWVNYFISCPGILPIFRKNRMQTNWHKVITWNILYFSQQIITFMTNYSRVYHFFFPSNKYLFISSTWSLTVKCLLYTCLLSRNFPFHSLFILDVVLMDSF